MNCERRKVRQRIDKDGYNFVILYKDGKPKKYHVHKAVWSSFNKEIIEEGMDIIHIDGNKRNNSLANLKKVPK